MMRPNKVGWVIAAFFLIGGVVFTVQVPEIWIGQSWIAVALVLVGYYVAMNRRADRAEKLRREGIPGEAQILEMTQTGMYVNDQPRVRLKLRIQASGVPAFEAEDTYTVPLIALGALTSGRVLQVYLDRADTSRFTIDWFGGVTAAAPTTSVESPTTTLDRLQKLTELKDSGLITDKEFQQQKARILDTI